MKLQKRIIFSISAVLALFILGWGKMAKAPAFGLKVSANHRFLVNTDGSPFFWLGDTGWLLFSKLDRAEADKYLTDRMEKGFNVIQVMVIHDVKDVNVYGDSALVNQKASQLAVTPGNSPVNATQYDYWDHVDYIVDLAAKKGLYIAMVPVWGSVVKGGDVSSKQAAVYAAFLAKRYGAKPNIIWFNGGDIPGSDSTKVWQTIGNTINKLDPKHLISFHPRGRTPSSQWFHKENWLDFNSFQSGHRRYAQDTSKGEIYHYGEDNWRFAKADYALKPTKPTIDSEPSYEDIPQGLHDTLQPRWKAADIRRYSYWSVFAGGFGITYGHNSVMQFQKKGEPVGNYGAKELWETAINAPGAKQMIWIKKLMLSRPFLERVPDQTLVTNSGAKYNYIAATRGKNYAFVYTYNGQDIDLRMGKITGAKVKASWYDPRNGKQTVIGSFANTGTKTFNPPGDKKDGNDWILILDSI